jgi:putative ABC transport system permease protein
MKVNNKKCVRKIANRCLLSNRRRNIITIAAIILTAVLFTTLFTISMSIKASYETSICRQLGGSNHATFKDVTDEQEEILKSNTLIKEYGERRVAGICMDAPFTKQSAEISYMDDTCAEWSFVKLEAGHMPGSYNEIIMDKEAVRLLGKEPVLGEEIELTFNINGSDDPDAKVTDTFVLVGYWEYDPLIPVHYINVSKEYVDAFNEKIVAEGYNPIRTDLNVMFSSNFDLAGKMEQVERECGFTSDDVNSDNYVRYGINPVYLSVFDSTDGVLSTVAPMLAFVLLVVFTGYLIIYNVFQISVASDIRFYGLLKTIGTTQDQIKRIIRHQALLLCLVGLPAGLIIGYGLGAVLTPAVLRSSSISLNSLTISSSPLIFVGAALFEIITVLISVSKPGKMAGKVSPIEALRYTESTGISKKKKTTKGAKVTQMAFANMERNKKKTVLVFISLALSLVILNVVNMFIGGFDVEKWLDASVATDFVVGDVHYFKFQGTMDGFISYEAIDEIKDNVDTEADGIAYDTSLMTAMRANDSMLAYYSERVPDFIEIHSPENESYHYLDTVVEGMDDFLIDKLEVLEGDASLLKSGGNYVAIMTETDEYGCLYLDESAPKVGDKIYLAVAENVDFINKTTGDVPKENDYYERPQDISGTYIGFNEEEYTVCAYVSVPFSLGPRHASFGYDMVMSSQALKEITNGDVNPMFYAFDTKDSEAENAAEEYVSNLCASGSSLEYESKAVKRSEFDDFRNMFKLLGGILSLIIGFVGLLNFFNTVMAGIIARKNEIAVLEAIGMTGKQVKKMLMTEGMIYTLGSGLVALILSLIFIPAVNGVCSSTFWFYSSHFSITPVVLMIPVMVVLGILVPLMSYKGLSRASIVERIREIG